MPLTSGPTSSISKGTKFVTMIFRDIVADRTHRIHMLPLLPSSAYTRNKNFVAQEWNAMFASNASTPAEKVEGGWKGILYANLALIDPAASWNFFAQPNFNYSWIDGGASRTWYLAYASGKIYPSCPFHNGPVAEYMPNRSWRGTIVNCGVDELRVICGATNNVSGTWCMFCSLESR